MLKKLSELESYLKEHRVRCRLVIPAAKDENVLSAAFTAHRIGIVDTTLIGSERYIRELAEEKKYDLSEINIINEENTAEAAIQSVRMVREGRADIIMNGEESYYNANMILRQIDDRRRGIRKASIMSHMAIFEVERYHKLIAVTDTVLNVAPDLSTKAGIAHNAVFFMRRLGIEIPKVAVLAAIEVVNEAMPATMHAGLLSKMAQRGQIKNCVIDGPLAFDNAISRESAVHKGIINEVAGDPDILLAPDIETANILYQSFVFFANARVASVTLGASAPIVFTSKLDTDETRVASILLAAAAYVPISYR
ncbi:MAG: bifunctional enoyl-CoA hydratase/phosphate acetyltransferase [Spirochaetes bacterium]|jgi:phosphate butyryltransferase|nr:bifunctional enoyl-CoA hydratase/phosphate acetyltransferase [Spirochaetota bacterium]